MSYIGSDQLCQRPVFRFPRMASKNMVKNLLPDFTDEPDDAIKVFLRLKPNNSQTEEIIEVIDSRTLLFKTPPENINARKKLNLPDQYKYTFSKIFESNVSQSDIFKGCVAQHVRDLFAGMHCLLFTYGTTNAGKTFTVLGNGEQPGIIPRTLTTIFKSIGDCKYKNARIMPNMFNSALDVTDKTLQDELNFKARILNCSIDKTQADISRTTRSQNTTYTRSSIDEILDDPVLRQMQSRLTGDTVEVEFDATPEDRFSVWVSFAEIYNEAIYDLLQPLSPSCRRPQLKISQDKFRNCYIKGLKHVFVENEEEAYKVLRFGKTNLQVASTGINSNSSRSHCIFSIKLMKCPNVDHPERVVVSSFSICDLAGAERQKKTLNDGLRLKESQNINSSLHVLSRCFSIIRENQTSNEQKLVPFRESKLTQLFQRALLGKESVTMIVNVNSEKYLYEETQHVLKASAIAKHIVVNHRPTAHRNLRVTRHSSFTRLVMKNKNRSTQLRWDSCVKAAGPDFQTLETIEDTITEPSLLESKQAQYEDLLILVDSLKEKLKEEKEMCFQLKKTWRKREDEIRNEMREELQGLLKKAKEQNECDKRRIVETTDSQNDTARRIEGEENDNCQAKKPKLTRIQLDNELPLTPNVNDLQDEMKVLQAEIDGLMKLVELFKEEKKELTMDLTYSKMQLGFRDREIENLKNKMELFGEESELKAAYLQMEKEMLAKIKQRDNLLEEAKADLLDELSNRDDMEEEIKRLEQELNSKDEKIGNLLVKINDLTDDADSNAKSVEYLEAEIEDLEEDAKKSEKQISDLQTELAAKQSSHKSEIDDLTAKLAAADEQLKNLHEEFDSYKQEYASKVELNTLNDLSAKDEMIDELNKEIMKHDEKVTEVIINLTEDYELKLKEAKHQWESKKDEYLAKISDLLQQLESEINKNTSLQNEAKKEYDSVKHDLEVVETKLADLQLLLERESLKNKKEQETNLSEISILEQNLKLQIQDTNKLQHEKEEKLDKLSKELQSSMKIIDALNNTIKSKEHELECLRSKLIGYEQMVPTLKSSLESQQTEKAAYRRKCEDLTNSLMNMEQEIVSFKNNQKEILGKYEDHLKKIKEENDTLKKEVARVTNTFYKSTPTPKKDLEKQIEDLRKELSETRATCHTLQKEKINMCQQRVRFPDGPDKENECVFENAYYDMDPSEDMIKSRLRCKSACEDRKADECEDIKSKSATKTRPRRTTRAVISKKRLEVLDGEECVPEFNKSSKQSCRKLFSGIDASTMNFNDVEIEPNLTQSSPNTLVGRRNLRTRHK